MVNDFYQKKDRILERDPKRSHHKMEQSPRRAPLSTFGPSTNSNNQIHWEVNGAGVSDERERRIPQFAEYLRHQFTPKYDPQ